MSTLPPVRRVVTGHDATGKAVVISDATFGSVPNPAKTALFTLVWTSPTAPADNDDATDGRDRDVDLTLPGGSVIRVTVRVQPSSAAGSDKGHTLTPGAVPTTDVTANLNTLIQRSTLGDIDGILQHLNLVLYAGRMPAALRQDILDAVTGVNGSDANSHRYRARVAVFMALTSPEFLVQR